MSEQRYAVLIACSCYPNEPKLQDLRCPENDVDGLNEVLTSLAHGEFTESIVLKNRNHHEILLKINQTLKGAGKDDLVLIYYSGHGKLDAAGRLHLTTINTVVDSLEATSIPIGSIRNYVDVSSTTKVALILDCCFSGAVEKAFLRGSIDDQLQLASGGRGTYIMTASTGIQAAQEKESDQYGVFTKHIIEGIKEGGADVNSDGLITMDELYSYVHRCMLEEGFQEPMKWDINVRGDLCIARSGKVPRESRRRKIRELLLDLANKGVLPDPILSKAMSVIAVRPTQSSEEAKLYDALLDRFVREKLPIGEFIDEWYRIGLEKPVPVVEKVIPIKETEKKTTDLGETEPSKTKVPTKVSDAPMSWTARHPKLLAMAIGMVVGWLISFIALNFDPYLDPAGAAGLSLFFGSLPMALAGALIGTDRLLLKIIIIGWIAIALVVSLIWAISVGEDYLPVPLFANLGIFFVAIGARIWKRRREKRN